MFEIISVPTAKKQLKCSEESTYKNKWLGITYWLATTCVALEVDTQSLKPLGLTSCLTIITQSIHNFTSINMKM